MKIVHNPFGFKGGDTAILDGKEVGIVEISLFGMIATVTGYKNEGEEWDVLTKRLKPVPNKETLCCILEDYKAQATELIQLGSSREKMIGAGMLEVIEGLEEFDKKQRGK